MNRLVAKGKVSTIFLTHPDEDHYNYLPHFAYYTQNRVQNIYLGGSKNLWNRKDSLSKKFVDAIIGSGIYNGNQKSFNYMEGKTKTVDLCKGLMKMEIIYGGYDRLDYKQLRIFFHSTFCI